MVALIALLTSSLFAVGDIGQANVKQYSVNIKKLEMYNSTTSTWIVLSDNAATVDIASGSAGADIASMISGDIPLTFGTYTQVRATIGNTFIVSACTSNACTNGSFDYTGAITVTDGQYNDGTHTVAIALTGVNLSAATPITVVVDFTDSAVTLPSGATASATEVVVPYTMSSPLILDESSTAPSISVKFDVDNVLKAGSLPPGSNLDADGGGDDGYIIVDFPTVNITVN